MRSELFRIPVELGGVPLFGVGLLLLAWVVGAAALLVWHVRTAGEHRDFWGYLTPAVLGALAIAFVPRLFPDGLPIRGYGVMLLTAVLTGVAMAVHRGRRLGIAADTIISLTVWLFVGGIGGARLFFVVEYWEERYAGRPPLETLIEALKFTEGGLVVYGSLIGGTLAFVAFAVRNGLPVLATADLLAPCFTAGLAIGRIGCLLNGCCFGGACDAPWAVTFPAGSPPFEVQLARGELHGVKIAAGPEGPTLVRSPSGEGVGQRVVAINGYAIERQAEVRGVIEAAYVARRGLTIRTEGGGELAAPATGRRRSMPIHPTQVYSAINAGLLAWLLWSWRPRCRGEVLLLLMTLYPVSRFLLEVIRTDEAAFFGTGMSISQNVSLGVAAIALVGWVLLLQKGRPAAA